mgnify:CR=1 FL=1
MARGRAAGRPAGAGERRMDRQRRERRESFAAQVPRAAKRALGATTTSQTPLHLRTLGVGLTPADRDYVRERASFKLGKFGLAITRVSVRVEDVSGPKGASVLECRIKVVLRAGPDVMVSAQAAAARDAFDRAVRSTERTVRRTIEKGQAARTRAGRQF